MKSNFTNSTILDFVNQRSLITKNIIWFIFDLIILTVSIGIGKIIFDDLIFLPLKYLLIYVGLTYLIYLLGMHLLSLNKTINRYISLLEIGLTGLIILSSNVFSSFIATMITGNYSKRFTFIVTLLSTLGVIGIRLFWKLMYNTITAPSSEQSNEKALLYGAGDGCSLYLQFSNRTSQHHNFIGIIDDNPTKIGTKIKGIPVLGSLEQLEHIKKEKDIDKMIVAIPSLSSEKYEEVLDICNSLDINVFKMPSVENIITGNYKQPNVQQVQISDLLGRKEIELDTSVLRNEIEGKVILITGAGGSIGSEIVRQISKHSPRKVILLGHGENSIYLIYHEIIEKYTGTNYVPVIADVQDYDTIYKIFKREKPDIIYHAAAHKHVPLMEANPFEAIKNNVYGSYNVAKAVDQAGVSKMVMISTDKAVRPTNIMGATKRMAELIVTGMNKNSNSIYCAVRFGNVLGSRGSVIPAFKKQIEEGGPVKVTDYEMTRYFMTIPEASRLVIYAGAFASNGEVFILDMGEPVKILDLARKMILLSGYNIDEIGIIESGIRPGEKLYEELLTDSEFIDRKINDKIMIGKVSEKPIDETLELANKLLHSKYTEREIKEIAIDYAIQSSYN
ncbi:polysaccharide biosynthesis protein [Facklamia sp. DSM 111018]|uniref:Polysaccharide biosynthesis protein n=1 Tax=Facklamia lactis TaxID=2749967 RepID=A0ABS0LMN1_9LACT|nr:nucleoside-diphosphate sugar epimerase/dehydratase [Facklamia lactis]MBG9979932.1 polysaccharide biosynthesis protein [Facklamia lactis]MBG9985388.1 polysaccharide biosynthesis protein [Facklamia lactis]